VLQTTEKKAYEFNLLLDAEDRAFLVFDFSKLQLASSGRASTIRNPVLRQLIKGSASKQFNHAEFISRLQRAGLTKKQSSIYCSSTAFGFGQFVRRLLHLIVRLSNRTKEATKLKLNLGLADSSFDFVPDQ
jgi:hypothetical protein